MKFKLCVFYTVCAITKRFYKKAKKSNLGVLKTNELPTITGTHSVTKRSNASALLLLKFFSRNEIIDRNVKILGQ